MVWEGSGPPVADSRLLHGVDQHCVGEKLAILDHEIDLGDVHVNHAPGAHVQVSDLTVSHLAGRQADKAPAGVDQCVGKLSEQLVIGGLARQ